MNNALYENNSAAELAAPIGPTDTTIELSTGQGDNLPQPNPANGDFFWGTLYDISTESLLEIVKCTNRVGDTLTVERAQQDTTGQSYIAGDRIGVRVTRDGLQDLVSKEDLQNQSTVFLTAGGDADNLTLTPPVPLTAYADGMRFMCLLPNGANPSSDVDISGLGAIALVYMTDQGTIRGIPGSATVSSPNAFIPPGFLADIMLTGGQALILNAKMVHRIGEFFWWSWANSSPVANTDILPPGALVVPSDVSPNIQIPRATYPELFRVLGTSHWNGDDPAMFGLPGVPVSQTLVRPTATEIGGDTTPGAATLHSHGVTTYTTGGATTAIARTAVGTSALGIQTGTNIGGSPTGNLPAGLYSILCIQAL